ncbi:unnamed protein product [Vitrella brassicaformis CCMP3155]|uniref:NAD(P)-binding domain-containing protein n=2 Tax=Vitrella brassicaformis TaxID=1169539 RepID=A0A0G4EID6_VITBC|nr:unnamed protein product [Vitrella brassicaformis CCMP3155]|mmetsp:Transcript_7353/g.17925  ORF Transcript_7353/g.17925 Transcript_7353/m.17925 type:complete len:257 (+) Transcript_7353:115-885(+)|eukprot:CEL95746.1 unnamed protein product [Vitrella brassicaformis CCMP3155]
MKILVLGGNGFVGSQICRKAIERGIEVVSLSRRGKATDKIAKEPWAKEVQWVAGSALDPPSFRSHLETCNGVIHSIGILLENNLNKFVSGSQASGAGLSYEQVNRDTALVVAREARRLPPVQSFVFVSAKSAPPFLQRYILAKRDVENELRTYGHDELRSAFLYAGMIYHESKPGSPQMASLLKIGSAVNETMLNYVGFGLSGVDEPTDLNTLAAAAVQASIDPNIEGIVDNQRMGMLATMAEEHPRDYPPTPERR